MQSFLKLIEVKKILQEKYRNYNKLQRQIVIFAFIIKFKNKFD